MSRTKGNLVVNTLPESESTNTQDNSLSINTGRWSAARNTGYQSVAINTGYRSDASVEGRDSLAVASGYVSRAKASKGSWIVIVFRDPEKDYSITKMVCAQAGVTKGVKPNMWYRLDRNGNLVEEKE
jgi:hypothetical protein